MYEIRFQQIKQLNQSIKKISGQYQISKTHHRSYSDEIRKELLIKI